MNLKYYIRGIGVGILFTAVVMSVAFHIFPNKKLTDAQIKERATELGMVEKTADGSLNDLLTTPTEAPTTTPAQTNTPAPTDTPTPTDTPAPTKTPASEDTSKEGNSKDTSNASGAIEINITQGMTSEQVSKLLKEKGIIEDSAAFSQYLVINNYTKSIKIGKFQLKAFTTYKDIVNLIIDK